MKTPKSFNENLSKKIITEEMLELCLYSVNKRAKNCRDQIRNYKHSRSRFASGYIDEYESKKEGYYKQKEILLSLLEPKCIHRVVRMRQHRKRIYNNEEEYYKIKKSDVIYENFYFDDEDNKIQFKDIIEVEQIEEYYLFYETTHYSFHQPLKDSIENYSNLPCHTIDLMTEGKKIDKLISAQFVRKVVELIKSGTFFYKK